MSAALERSETAKGADLSFIAGGGEAGALMRATDWSRTPLGPPAHWPNSLKVAVRILLDCRLPMYIAWGRQHTQLYNDAYRPILGRKHPSAMGSSVTETWPEIWPTIGPMWDEVWQGRSHGFDGFKLTIERHGYFEDCYFNFSYSPVPDDSGAVGGVLVTFAETTDKVLTEQRVKQERERLFTLLMEAPAPVAVVTGHDFVFELTNPRFVELLAGREVSGKRLREALPELPADSPLLALFERVAATGEAVNHHELRIALGRAGDGALEERVLQLSCQPLRDGQGHVTGIISVLADVTEQRRQADTFKLQSYVLNSMAEGVSLTDESGTVLYTNPAEDALFGHEPGELLEQNVSRQSARSPEENLRVSREIAAALETDGVWVGEFQNVRRSGEVFTSRATVTALELSGRRLRVRVQEDVTREKQVEEEKRRRQEFEQQLIGIVSHDLRNPLSAIMMNASALMRREDLDDRAMKSIRRILNSAERAGRMIRDLLDFTQSRFGGGIPIQPGPVDLHALCQQVVEELRASFPERDIHVSHDGDGQGQWDADRIAQLLSNLLTNALSYSPADSPVHVALRGSTDTVEAEIRNAGEPIPPERLGSLFRPMNRGTARKDTTRRSIGLGLYIVREIAQAHRGEVTVRSEAAEGTVFRVRLPRVAAVADPTAR
jgi:PAS domain S-box-containing protein